MSNSSITSVAVKNHSTENNLNEKDDSKNVPSYLVETVENLLYFLSLSKQNEMGFPSTLFVEERAYIHRRARELGFHAVTERGVGLSERSVFVYKNKPSEKITTKYPIVIIHNMLSKIFFTMEKYPLTTTEFRIFITAKDYDDLAGQDGDMKSNRDLSELDFSFTVFPSQTQKSGKFNSAMNDYRKSLPIFNYKQIILSYLTENKVLIINGGVAAGKSTQVPQFLMEKCYEVKVGYKIFLCEPYRITTVAVAERIAFERCEEIGQSVGYQIPLETKKSATSIVICITPDVLLKMLISREQVFQGKVIVILDEFEENDYVTEFLLIALKDLFKVNPFLRVIIMTNGLNVNPLLTHFSSPKTELDTVIKTATITTSNLIPIQEFFLEDILMRTDYLNRCRMKPASDVQTFVPKVDENGASSIEHNITEVIDAAMEKVWNSGEDDIFTFLLNVVKKDVISVNYQLNSNGITLLMAACHAEKLKYVSELLKSGADTTIRCKKGFTAVDWASKRNCTTIIEFIQNYLLCNNEKMVLDREFIKLTASTNLNEHTKRLITYYDNFYPEQGVDLELLFTVVLYVHAFSKPGAVMIFLPSFFDILSFRDMLFERESELVSSGGSFIIRFLYSNMQTSEQKLIFQIPPLDCRKIILSTNVGAVGLTISDLVYVIDTGKIEQKMYVNHTGKLSFVTGWISLSHALQRSSKVGRLQPGCCYRLYSQLMSLPEKNPTTNLYTCSPQILCLYTKQMVPQDTSVINYLRRALTVPESSTLKQSVDILKSIDAFDICRNYEYLTSLGKIMLQLPLEPQYAKMVLYSVALKCLDPILTIAAFSKHKSIFKLEEKYKRKSHIAAKEWKKVSSKYFSDHLILIKLFLERQSAGIEKHDKEFCEEFCISQSTLELVNTTRSNIVGHLRAMGIVKTRGVNDMRDLNSNSKEWVLVKAALVGGLYPNLVFVDRSGTKPKLYCNKSGNEVLLHSLSSLLDYSSLPSNQTTLLMQQDVVQNLPTDWIVCNDVSNSYSDETHTATVCTAVTPLTLAIFAGSYKICAALQNERTAFLFHSNNLDLEESDSEDENSPANVRKFMIDSHLQFSLNDETAKAVLYLRIKWFSFFLRCIKSPSKPMTVEEKMLLETIVAVLKNEENCKFSAGDPDFISHKPVSYTIDLLQQPTHNKALADLNVVNSSILCTGLITENSRYFLIRSYKYNNIAASILNGFWRFEPSTESKLIEVFKTGAEVKLIFQFTGTNCFQGMAMLLSDRFCNQTNFLPIQWLKEGLVPMATVEEYFDATTSSKLAASSDGTELDCSLASTLMMMWNTSHIVLRGTMQIST